MKINPFGEEQEQAERIQALFDSFVAIRSEQLEDLIRAESLRNDKVPDARWLQEYVLNILVENDNLYSLAEYVRQGSEEYYWYSDFLDELEKDDKKKYYFYDTSTITVSKSSFDKTLRSVDLPFFGKIIELVSALQAIERLEPEKTTELELQEEPEAKLSFKSTLNPAQLVMLTETINDVKLFKNILTAEELTELLSGHREAKLQTRSTKLLYYLFQKLSEGKYITIDWWDIFLKNSILVSARGKVVENQDFRGAKQRVFGEFEGILPKNHRIIDDFLDEIAELSEKPEL